MAHSICSTAQNGQLPYFRRLWDTLLAPGVDPERKLEQLFAVETEEFGLGTGFFTRIDPDAETQRFELVYGPQGELTDGNTVPLSESYCRKTIADPEGTMAVSDAAEEGWKGDPAYERFGLGSYVGTTVSIDGELYGTLCFADVTPRSDPISDEEIILVEMLGDWLTYELTRLGEPTNATPGGVEDRVVPPERLDSMLDALGSPTRRLVLLRLLEEPHNVSLDTLKRSIDTEHAAVQLHHNHLPKLERGGYIEQDADAGTVSRGPEFDDIEALLELLQRYGTESSG